MKLKKKNIYITLSIIISYLQHLFFFIYIHTLPIILSSFDEIVGWFSFRKKKFSPHWNSRFVSFCVLGVFRRAPTSQKNNKKKKKLMRTRLCHVIIFFFWAFIKLILLEKKKDIPTALHRIHDHKLSHISMITLVFSCIHKLLIW